MTFYVNINVIVRYADDTINAAKTTQRSVIASVENSTNGSKGLSNIQKGNYGEMKMDVYFESLGYERISGDRVIGLNQSTHHGIDGVYFKPDGHPPFIIAEAKYGSSKLGKTRDGIQMSDTWIRGSNRLENAVGKVTADDILEQGFDKFLVNIASDGTMTVTKLQ